MNPNAYCTHPDCQAHAAEELLYMARRLLSLSFAELALKALHGEVRCRHVPRKGPPVNAPLPRESK